MRQALVFITHLRTNSVMRHYFRLRAEVENMLDCFLAVGPSPEAPHQHSGGADFDLAVHHARAILPRRVGEYHIRNGGLVLPGYTDLLTLPMLNSHRLRRYDYIWMIEYDVDYSGHWREFFNELIESTADLLGTTLFPRHACPDWHHWTSFRTPGRVDAEYHVRSFVPIVRFSRRMIESYLEEMALEGWEGHIEALYPTVAGYRGLAIQDLGGRGPFCPLAWRGKNYTNTPGDAGLFPGTFVYRPVLRNTYYHEAPHAFPQAGFLHHPVKTGELACDGEPWLR